MRGSRRGILSGTYSDYVKTHCGTCAAGWTRTGQGAMKPYTLYTCLLDREPIFQDLTHCDRYEPKEEAEPDK